MTTDEVGTVVAAGVKAVDWGWRHASRKDFALRHVDFEIKPGERVLLLGASGAGKSTLMAGLAGVLGGDDEGEQEGSLLIDGIDSRPGTHAPPSARTSPMALNTSSGEPSAMTPPSYESSFGLPSTITRSTRSSHTSIWCSTTTIVSWPRSSTCLTASCTSCTPSGSRFAVGSSSNSSPGCMASTPANANR